jgi:hypothetical protein
MDFQPLSFKVPIKIMNRSERPENMWPGRLESRFTMTIFDRGGEGEWKSLKRWDCIVSNTVAVSIVRKKGLRNKKKNDFTAEPQRSQRRGTF